MATKHSTRRRAAHTSPALPEKPPGLASDLTADRIRAYLASLRSLRGVSWRKDIEQMRQRGAASIERLASSAEGTDEPALMLSSSEGADILRFVSTCEPIEPRTWWAQPLSETSRACGFFFVLEAVERCLRRTISLEVDRAGAADGRFEELTKAEEAWHKAYGLIDVLAGAASHGALEPPANEEALAQTLNIVRDLLAEIFRSVWPSGRTVSTAGQFTDGSAERKVLEDLPAAAACPFCGHDDDIHINVEDGEEMWYRVTCGHCGVDAPGGATMRDAAAEWNTRGKADMSSAKQLTRKCARALALLEAAQQLCHEVLEDPAYRAEGVLPRGVIPASVDDYLEDAISMLRSFTAEELRQFAKEEASEAPRAS